MLKNVLSRQIHNDVFLENLNFAHLSSSMNHILETLFLFGWYPFLWIVFFILCLFSFGEKQLEHDEMTYRAIWSQNIGAFLCGRSLFWLLMIFFIYLLGLIFCFLLGPVIAVGLIALTLVPIATVLDYGQIHGDDRTLA